jgi:putative ABC transport system substrate-binding protein
MVFGLKGAPSMQRREFLTLLGAAAAWPLAARAQQSAVPVIGLLCAGAKEPQATFVAAFRGGLAEAGFVEGRNVLIEPRYAENDRGRLPDLAADLVRRRVVLIATLNGVEAAQAAKAASATIPIVFEVGGDPVRAGLVASFNRPGGNLTGVSILDPLIEPKRLGLLHELAAQARRFAALLNTRSRNFATMTGELQAGAAALGVEVEILAAANEAEIDSAFESLAQKRIEALLVTTSPLFSDQSAQIIALAARARVPTMYFDPHFAAGGGLASYGPSYPDQVRQVGRYAGRVLKGEKPADLPVMQPTKFALIINLKTAKALGLTVPPTLLAIADEVIE